ncbi:MAG: ATP-binding cassette domain-containing protein [Bacteroidia bacterium]
MLHLQNISFEIGGNYLFQDVDWFIKPKERIALIGKNGAGKSTLLKLITGQYELREGQISKQGAIQIGYLSQDMISEDPKQSVLSSAMTAFAKALEIQNQMDEMLELVEKDPSESNVEKLANMQEDFNRLGGYQMENKAAEILEGLGFTTADLERPLEEFSGGWRMRAILAKMLLSEPDVMLMDEPTNHLDLPSIMWLEGYLSSYKGAVVIVSHDREFLNKMTNKTVELSNGQCFIWEGNYDFYLKAKVERDELLARKLENQKQFIKDQEKFISRFRYKASKAKAVQSRVKMLEKLDRIEEIASDNSKINIQFRVRKPSGKVVMETKNIHKSFGTQEIFNGVERQISRGDKIALIGANGTGKSTFLRIIANQESFEGERKEGHNVISSFYAQHQLENLHLINEILDELKAEAPHKSETELRNLLGCFLFSGDDVYKKIKVLSGGEKARVALSKTLVSEANFLLLDEPTNHLDIDSIELLIDALSNYEGSLIFVSHNRYFISRLANKVWWIENKDVREYPGTYDEFVRSEKQQSTTHVEQSKKVSKAKKGSWRKEKDSVQEEIKLEKELDKLQGSIKELELQKSKLESELAQLDHTQIEELKKSSELLNSCVQEMSLLQEQEELILEKIIALEDKSSSDTSN